MTTRPPYILISPCRDEVRYARRTLDSVLSQTHPPAEWVIVDDGSSDGTSELLAEYAARHACIRVLRREDRGRRSVGPGVIDAFYAGWDACDPARFEYLCKLDLDLDLPPRYFEILIDRMQADPRLGTCSGKPFFPAPDGTLESEACGDEMSVGMTKLYRRACFEQIGGFVRGVMWDGIDCHRARMLGWTAKSFRDAELEFVHLRPMGSSQDSLWTGRFRHGAGQWFMGTGLGYMTASAIFRATRRPWLVGGLAMWCGWIASCVRRAPRYEDREFRRFLRRFQRASLVLGKRRATESCERACATAWKPAESPLVETRHGALA